MVTWFQTRAGLDPNVAGEQFSEFAGHLPIFLSGMAQQFLDSTQALTLEAKSPVPTPRLVGCQFAYTWSNQIGPLQQYRYDLGGKVRSLVYILQEDELQDSSPAPFMGPVGC